MKYQITAEQHHFFSQNHYIQFEELFSASECAALVDVVHNSGKKRDLVQSEPRIKQTLLSPHLAGIASELCLKRPLRYAFDEVISEKPTFSTLSSERCIQGLELAMMLCIKEGQNAEFGIFATALGSATFFHPELAVSSESFCGELALLVGWCSERSLYVCNMRDPFVHELKRLGYVFGDKLKSTTHPIVWR